MECRIPRHDDIDLVFEGELLAETSSHTEGMSRWSEVRIYKTEKGQWVTEVVGRSTNPGEVDLYTVSVHQHPETVRLGLMRNVKGEQFLTTMGRQTLYEAARADPDLMPGLIERI